MTQRLTCEQVVARLTDLEEGALPFAETFRLRLHLLHCLECRELGAELRKIPAVMQAVTASASPRGISRPHGTGTAPPNRR